MSKAGESFRSMYESPNDVPENFIMQIAFTAQNSFMLTTDGRLFSWGDNDNPASGVGAEAVAAQNAEESANMSQSNSSAM